MHNQCNNRRNLSEGLRPGDLNGFVANRFTVDRYKSKMGKDENIVVIAFKVNDKFPAIDLMEFIEKGYPQVLDADMSAGEESDGQYSVFVEFERTEQLPRYLDELLKGIDRLCKCKEWKFRYYQENEFHTYSPEEFRNCVPLTKEAYRERVKMQKVANVAEVLNRGATEILNIDEQNNVTLARPFGGNITFNVESIGDSEVLEQNLRGHVQLDEASNGQILFLEKYLGVSDIHKIDDKFLIRNNNKAMIISFDRW